MRRIITGLNGEGKSCVMVNEEIPATPMGGMVYIGAHADLAERVAAIDPALVPPIEPPRGGSRVGIIRWPPHEQYLKQVAARGIPRFGPKGEHVTRTIDYIYVMEGELWLDLEAESVLLHPGDIVVQLATMHAWRTEKGATTLGCMIDVLPAHLERV